MDMRTLASDIAKREGKKTQARIGEVREILSIIVEMEAEWIKGAVLEGDPKKRMELSPCILLMKKATAKAKSKKSDFKK